MINTKKIISIITILTMAFTNIPVNLYVQANGEDLEQIAKENRDKILSDFGIEEEFIDDMIDEEKDAMAFAILSKPETVSFQESVKHFDELSMIEEVVNSSDESLLKNGMNKEYLKECRASIDTLNNYTDKELKKIYKKSDTQIKLIRMALEPDAEFCKKSLSNNVATSSGSITTSDMTFKLTGYNNSSVTKKPVSYRLCSSFKWKTLPLLHMKDESVICWGGGLNSKNILRIYYTEGGKKYSKAGIKKQYDKLTWYGRKELSAVTQTVNYGIRFTFDTCMVDYGDDKTFMDRGYHYVTVYNNSKQKLATKALSRYGHRVTSIGIESLSFTSLPNIKVGKGYDYTYEAEYNPINY